MTFFYIKKSESSKKVFLQCSQKNDCSATSLIFKSSNKLVLQSTHSHPSDPVELNAIKFKNQLKNNSENSTEGLRKIFDDVSRNYQISSEYGFQDVNRSMENRRRMCQPKIPVSCEEFCDLIYQNNLFNAYFWKKVDVNATASCAIFHDPLCFFEPTTICFDATFFVTPKPFYQLFTIFGFFGTKSIPIFYVLMGSKRQDEYNAVFSTIKQHYPYFSLLEAISDFENASKNAFLSNFPNSNHNGCYFHFKQSVIKYLNTHSLKIEFCSNLQFKCWANLIMGTVFLPPNKVVETFEKIASFRFSSDNLNNKCVRFITYFRRQWLTNPFKINLFDAKITTNNSAESYHSQLKERIGRRRNVWDFLNHFNGIIQNVKIDFERMQNNIAISRSRPEVRINIEDLKIQLLNSRIDEIDFIAKLLDIDIDSDLFEHLNPSLPEIRETNQIFENIEDF